MLREMSEKIAASKLKAAIKTMNPYNQVPKFFVIDHVRSCFNGQNKDYIVLH